MSKRNKKPNGFILAYHYFGQQGETCHIPEKIRVLQRHGDWIEVKEEFNTMDLNPHHLVEKTLNELAEEVVFNIIPDIDSDDESNMVMQIEKTITGDIIDVNPSETNMVILVDFKRSRSRKKVKIIKTIPVFQFNAFERPIFIAQ